MNTSTFAPSRARLAAAGVTFDVNRAARRAPVPHALAGACFVLMMVLGLVSNGYGWLNEQLKLARPVSGWRAVMTGEPMQQFAAAMAHAPLPLAGATLERELSWLVTRDLGPRVREGERDWLYLNDEFTPHPHGAESAASRAAEVIRLRQRLAAQGVDLLVVVVPDKSRIEVAHLGTLHRPAAFAERISQWTDRLVQAGVPVVDLSATLGALQQQGQQAFLRTDSHWAEAGAAAAATQVALHSQALDNASRTGAGVQLADRANLPRPGDLVRLAGLDGLPLALQPRPESAFQSRFEVRQAAPARDADKSNADLFGDIDLPTVALIGTSFSRNSNFAPFLALELRAKVANFAVDGGDFGGAARAYLSSSAFRQTPPKLLIWEIPERVLQADRQGDHVE